MDCGGRVITPESAWRWGYNKMPLIDILQLGGDFKPYGSDWIIESHQDGYRHALSKEEDAIICAAQVKNTKALREKFKRIREAHKR